MKLERILFLLIFTLCYFIVIASSHDLLTDYFSSFVHLPFTDKPVTRYYNLKLKKTKLSPDGFERLVWAANDVYPGQIIRANKGDRIVVNVINNLGDSTGIHWHGIFQLGTNWYDGAPGFTQCPIPDGVSFVYNFTTGKQSGTYWWHSHHLSQYIDGLRGSLIVHDPDDPYLKYYDEEYVLTLEDWFHDTASYLLSFRLAPGYQGQDPIPDSGLISGRGRYNCSAAPEGSKCKSDAPLAIYKFKKGKKYRLRLINMSANVFHMFSIDEHKLTIIEVDGEYVKPYTVEKLPISIAQRYSVIVKANCEIKNYWIRATIQETCLANNNFTYNSNSAINYKVVGILKYLGADDNYPTTKESDEQPELCKDLPTKFFVPLYAISLPEPYKTFVMNITFGRNLENVTVGMINGNSYLPDYNYPTLKKILDKVNPNSLPADQVPFVYDKPGATIEIRLFNPNIHPHPFHLHGHTFQVLGIGNGTKVDENKLNKINPFSRDTVTVPIEGWVVLRYATDNPGIWGFHCHIEWHMEMGLAAQMIELPSLLGKRKPPKDVRALCYKNTKETH